MVPDTGQESNKKETQPRPFLSVFLYQQRKKRKLTLLQLFTTQLDLIFASYFLATRGTGNSAAAFSFHPSPSQQYKAMARHERELRDQRERQQEEWQRQRLRLQPPLADGQTAPSGVGVDLSDAELLIHLGEPPSR